MENSDNSRTSVTIRGNGDNEPEWYEDFIDHWLSWYFDYADGLLAEYTKKKPLTRISVDELKNVIHDVQFDLVKSDPYDCPLLLDKYQTEIIVYQILFLLHQRFPFQPSVMEILHKHRARSIQLNIGNDSVFAEIVHVVNEEKKHLLVYAMEARALKRFHDLV